MLDAAPGAGVERAVELGGEIAVERAVEREPGVHVTAEHPAKVIFGPKTRLGRALLELAPAESEPTVLVARTESERAALALRWPAAVVVGEEEAEPKCLHGRGRIAIHVCALGPIHPVTPPERPDRERDARAVERELAIVARLLRAHPEDEAHVVFVSSVLALGSGKWRRYYAGWKCLIEATLEGLIAEHPKARLSVLYPGRLVEERSLASPASLAHGRYRALAARMIALAARPGRRRALFGLDARVWMLLRGLRTLGSAIRPTLPD